MVVSFYRTLYLESDKICKTKVHINYY